MTSRRARRALVLVLTPLLSQVAWADPASDWLIRADPGKNARLRSADCVSGMVRTSASPGRHGNTEVSWYRDVSAPWYDVGQLFPDGFWGITRNDAFERESFVPRITLVPQQIVADGTWKVVNAGCEDIVHHYPQQGQTGCGPVGSGVSEHISDIRYIVYASCEGGMCDGETVPVIFETAAPSVLRVQYHAGSGSCPGPSPLTEEQWFVQGYGWTGFYNSISGCHVDLVSFLGRQVEISDPCHATDIPSLPTWGRLVLPTVLFVSALLVGARAITDRAAPCKAGGARGRHS